MNRFSVGDRVIVAEQFPAVVTVAVEFDTLCEVEYPDGERTYMDASLMHLDNNPA
jgi:hypothetical protein